jgi:hypothetical protein
MTDRRKIYRHFIQCRVFIVTSGGHNILAEPSLDGPVHHGVTNHTISDGQDELYIALSGFEFCMVLEHCMARPQFAEGGKSAGYGGYLRIY